MRAAFIETRGGPEALKVGPRPDPKPGPNDVLIRVRASSLDRLDIYSREGSHGVMRQLPYIGGRDIAGDILEIGSEARSAYPDLAVGQPVVALGAGAHAEIATAPAMLTFALPPTCDYAAAAAIPTAGRSAYDALVNRARIQAGEDVLVIAGGSGVGSFGIQIARAAGCRVITTVGAPGKFELASRLGAEPINHYEENVAERVRALTGGRGVDVVLDHVGAPMWDAAFKSLADGGRFVTTGVTAGHMAQIHLGQLFTRGLELHGVGRPDDARLRRIMLGLLRLVANGQVAPVVHAVLPLSEIANGHRMLEASSFFGKIVIRMDEEAGAPAS